MERVISFIGIFVLIGIAYLFSTNKKAINYRTVITGTLIQIVFAFLVLKFPPGRKLFEIMNDIIIKVISFSIDGAKFVFGSLAESNKFGFLFAFQVLPTIIFFSSLMSVLYYLGIMQKIVVFFAKIMTKFMGTSGAESLSASANIFVGQTEAPLVIKPYVSDMTKSELLAVMTGGMATIAGGVMAAYIGILKDKIPDIAGHLLSASIISAPAALVMAKIIIPETEEPKTKGQVKIHVEITDANIIDAAANGATTGLTLALNVGACLIAFMGLLAFGNYIISLIHPSLTLEKIMGWIFYPITWVMGVPVQDIAKVSEWMGQKTILNEFVAYFNMAEFVKSNPDAITQRSAIIASYALCGFSNFLSIAIQIGGIGGIAPNRRHDLAKLGLYALVAGSLACFMTAAIAGLLI